MPPRNLVVVAMPDHLHFERDHDRAPPPSSMSARVKPLVLRHQQALEIEREARARGLLVGVEYHKRFDDRSLMARRATGRDCSASSGSGTACLLEKWYYRHSNFQNW